MSADEEEEAAEAGELLFPLLVVAQRLNLESLVALCEGYIREVNGWMTWDDGTCALGL